MELLMDMSRFLNRWNYRHLIKFRVSKQVFTKNMTNLDHCRPSVMCQDMEQGVTRKFLVVTFPDGKRVFTVRGSRNWLRSADDVDLTFKLDLKFYLCGELKYCRYNGVSVSVVPIPRCLDIRTRGCRYCTDKIYTLSKSRREVSVSVLLRISRP